MHVGMLIISCFLFVISCLCLYPLSLPFVDTQCSRMEALSLTGMPINNALCTLLLTVSFLFYHCFFKCLSEYQNRVLFEVAIPLALTDLVA